MDLSRMKRHLRVDHYFEDDLIADYQAWAEEEIKDSVSTEVLRNESFFEGNPHFERAVFLLTSHYFENRIGYSEKSLSHVPDGILSAVQKLRGSYVSLEGVIANAQPE